MNCLLNDDAEEVIGTRSSQVINCILTMFPSDHKMAIPELSCRSESSNCSLVVLVDENKISQSWRRPAPEDNIKTDVIRESWFVCRLMWCREAQINNTFVMQSNNN